MERHIRPASDTATVGDREVRGRSAAPWVDPGSASSAFRGDRPLLALLAEQRRQRVNALLRGLEGAAPDELPLALAALRGRTPHALAQALSELLGPAELATRLRAAGFPPEWVHGRLTQISPSWLSVETGGRGLLITGPALTARLLRAFPELLPLTARNGSLTILPGSSAETLVVDPPATSGSLATYWDLSGVGSDWVVEGATAYYTLGGTGFDGPMASDPYGYGGYDPVIEWPAAGWTWIEANAGDSNASPGNMSLTIDWEDLPGEHATLDQSQLAITYAVCTPCSLTVTVLDACSGATLSGVTVQVGEQQGTTNSYGQVEFSSIDCGTFTYTIMLTGYAIATDSVNCNFPGGYGISLNLTLSPLGGCGGGPPCLNASGALNLGATSGAACCATPGGCCTPPPPSPSPSPPPLPQPF